MLIDESPDTTVFIRMALDMLGREGPMTFKQLFWRLVCAGEVPNDLENYEGAKRTMTRIREDGRCPIDWILDYPHVPLTIDGNETSR
jgi:hypothetical protein